VHRTYFVDISNKNLNDYCGPGLPYSLCHAQQLCFGDHCLLWRNNKFVIHYACMARLGLIQTSEPEKCCKFNSVLPTGIFSMCLVYNFLIWYIRKIWYMFGIFLSEGLVEISNQFIWFITKRKQSWGHIKKFSDFS